MRPLIIVALLIALCSAISFCQIPRTLSYQGVLNDTSSGVRQFTFTLYDSSSGGTELWSSGAKSLQANHGLFHTVLGDDPPFDDSLKFDKQYWLGMTVDGGAELTPRTPFTTVPYSMNARTADTARISLASNPMPEMILSSGFPYLSFQSPPNRNMRWELSPGGDFYLYDQVARTYRLMVSKDGFIGIGEEHPNYKLTISNGSILLREGFPSIRFLSNDGHPVDMRWEANPGNDFYLYDQVASSYKIMVQSNGNVGIGVQHPNAKLDIAGRTKTEVLEITGGGDLAEPFPVTNEELVSEGCVVVIDEENSGNVRLSSTAYDRKIAGVISGAGGIKPGLTLKQEGKMDGSKNVALTGRVYVKATAENGSIRPGDRLVTASLPGHCMKATDAQRCDGAVLGKAMSSLESGEGLVLVLINLQ